MLTVASVLRSGGDFRPEHVYRLRDQLRRFVPNLSFVCFSDKPLDCRRIELENRWPGWWSKIELLAPWVRDDLLYFDLDTTIVGDLAPLVSACGDRPILMRDVYRQAGLQSSVMFIPAAAKASAWRGFVNDPGAAMARRGRLGDQGYLEEAWPDALRWQDVVPGAFVSFKADVRPAGRVPEGACAVVFHGKPRPWQIAPHERAWFGERETACVPA